MKTNIFLTWTIAACAFLALMVMGGCTTDLNNGLVPVSKKSDSQRIEIGLQELIAHADLTTTVISRSPGYHARATGIGTIPEGEYAGWRFNIMIEGYYSDVGDNTLESGSAEVRIRSERFVSVMDVDLQSFCCGEGYLFLIDGEWIFSMFGQVVHSTAPEPHNHLFAGLATTAGTMNMNIVDQYGSAVDLADPPHNPGIGLLVGFNALYVNVAED